MLTVDEACGAVLRRAAQLPPGRAALADALGLVLAEDVPADLDLPPFDKAMVDGYAIRAEDLRQFGPRLTLGEEIPAGRVATRPLAPGEAASIMTGAPLPEGADAVVMVEHTRRDGAIVLIDDPGPIEPGKNRLPRAREMKAGDIVLPLGTILNPAGIGLLASVGRVEAEVIPRPEVALVPTGDELVEPHRTPGPGQIRNSSSAMLAALAASCGAVPRPGPIVRDEPQALREALGDGLESDVLLITGGVSAGTYDLVPGTLEALGVDPVFHKVRVKPGKPLWFGVGPGRTGGRPGTLVFGLPGNPVSGVVSFLLFVRPALAVLMGREGAGAALLKVTLGKRFEHRGDRPTYYPCRLVDGNRVEPLDWAGSADLRTVAMADGFAAFPAGDRVHEPGEEVGFLPIT